MTSSNTFRAECFLRANNLPASIVDRVDGELKRVDGLPWTAAFLLWIRAQWRAWESQASKADLSPSRTQAAFDLWLSSSCGVSQ